MCTASLIAVLLVVAVLVPIAAAAPGDFRLAFSSDREDEPYHYGLWTMRPDGGALTRLTRAQPVSDGDGSPAWSPDGKRLAFRRSAQAVLGVTRYDIYVMHQDGSNQRNLTNDAAQDHSPAWSPDGSMIAYETVNPSESIVVVDAELGTAADPIAVFDSVRGATWAPDGSAIAWADPYWGIVVAAVDGSWGDVLVNTPYEESAPAWSPDGEEIAFISHNSGRFARLDIFVASIETGAVRNVTSPDWLDEYTDTSDEREPEWSPDGRQIAFTSDRTGDYDIYVINADGTNEANVTKDPTAWDGNPAWGVEPQPPPPPSPAASKSTPPPDRTPPTFSDVSLSRARFKVAPRGGPARRARPGRGTTLRYSSSEAGVVEIGFDKVRTRNPCKTGRTRPRCRFRVMGGLRYPAKPGRNKQRITGRIGSRGLSPGRYRMRLRAVDGAGNRSSVRSLRFTIVPH